MYIAWPSLFYLFLIYTAKFPSPFSVQNEELFRLIGINSVEYAN